MANAEIIAIGSELLLGETQDTNTNFILKELRNIGVNVFRTMIIGDNPERIAGVIREAFTRADILITTGGLGPTVDDPTREATALAFDCPVEFREEQWQRISEYFIKLGRAVPSNNNKRQAYFPSIAVVIPNPVGTAPAYYIHQNGKLLISLPGVPSEMRFLLKNAVLDLIREIFPSENMMLVKTLHTFGLGESVVDELVSDLETSANPTLGLSARQGLTDLRITAFGNNYQDAKEKISQFEMAIRNRFGNKIYGEDDETLPHIVRQLLIEHNEKLVIHEFGTGGKISAQFPPELLSDCFLDQWDQITDRSMDGIRNHFEKLKDSLPTTLIGIRKQIDDDFNEIYIVFCYKGNIYQTGRKFNSRVFSEEYISLAALDLIRTSIQN